MKEYPSSLFTWNRQKGTGSADCSDLGITASMPNPTNFAVISSKSGKRREFYRMSEFQQDIQRYATLDKLPLAILTLFND